APSSLRILVPEPSTAMGEPASRVLGQLLLAAGVVDAAELAAALEEQRRTRERLGAVLVRRGLDARHVARALARQLRLTYAEPPLAPEAGAIAVVDRALAVRLRVLPLAANGRTLRVAMADPLDTAAVDDLQFQTGRPFEPVVTTPRAVAEAMAAANAAADVVVTQDDETGALVRASEAPPIVALVEELLERAIAQRASDLHVEPAAAGLRVRARVDGVLRETAALPADVALAVVSR